MLDGLDTGASDSDTVVILPAMAGGGPLAWSQPGEPPVSAVNAPQAGFGSNS